MNVTTPFKRLPIVAKSLGIGLFLVSSLYAATQPKKIKYDTLIYVPVTFYDYRSNNTFGFEQCMSPAGTTVSKGLVQDTIQKGGGKPIATALACNTTTPSTYPCACSLNEWFKPTGYKTATNLKFEQVRTFYKNDTIAAFRWTGLTRNAGFSTVRDTLFTLPGWDSSTVGANLVYYSYLPFKLVDSINGTYSFDRTGANQFFWLDNIGYGNEGRDHNFAFTMELHQEFTYQGDNSQLFGFSGDDDVWAYIDGKLVMDLGGVHGEQRDSFNLNTKATALGLVPGKKYWLDVFYTERHTTQSNCRITSNLLRPYLDTVIVSSAPNLCPGDTNILTAKIFDKDSSEMTWLEDSIRWEIISPTTLDANDKLINTKGKTARFTATKAWRTIIVRASVYDPYLPDQKKFALDTFTINVCSPNHIVIEGSPTPGYWGDQPLESVLIGPKDTLYNKLFAVVRDTFGNLAGLKAADWFTSSTATTWTSAITKIATVQGENGAKYHGTATRADSAGDVKVTASDASNANLKPGSVIVKVSNYYYVKLRLVDLKTGKVVDTLKIETDSTGRYKIQGLKSTYKDQPENPNAWEDAQGKVDLKDTLKTDCPLTTNGNTWNYCPSNHGTGRVILTNPNDTNTATTIIPVVVTLSKPKLYLEILTPPLERIAGDTLKFRAYIKNDDGLIPIPYCFGGSNADIKDSIAYFDNLGRGGAAKPESFTLVNDKLPINFDFEKYYTSQCFQNGSDTFGIVLYYAPFNFQDSLHVIKAIAGNLQAETEKFRLFPGPLYTLKLEDNNWVERQGPVHLKPENDVFSTVATGYDKFGNRIGHQNSEWSVTNTLDPSKLTNTNGEKTTYQSLNETDSISGKLVAQAKGVNDSLIIASIELIVDPPVTKVVSAVTRDINGNGILDRIDVTFHKSTKFALHDGNLSIANTNPTVILTADSIKPADISGKTYYIYLSEADKSKPQTGWTPKMTLSNFPGVENTTVIVKDGAAPVVWKAHKQINSTGDRMKDVITVTLSEKIAKGGGSNLATVETKPELVLKIWEKSAAGVFIYDSSMLRDKDGKQIKNFDRIKDDSGSVSILIFKMTNNQDITDNDWVNIFYENRLIADESSNYTHELNQKVPFVISGKGPLIEVIPDPAIPTTAFGKPGKIELMRSKNEAFEMVKNGGVIMKLTLPIPNDSTVKDIYIKTKLYDVVGNQVASMAKEKVGKDKYLDKSSTPTFYFVYPGMNEQGMKVAPGWYKFIAWIEYNSSKIKNEKLSLNVGFKK